MTTKTKRNMSKKKAGGLTGAPATEKQRLDAIRDIERSGKTVKTSKAARNGRTPGLLTIAATILASSKEALDCKALVAEAQARHGWTTGGKTPHATLYAAITREIAARGDEARFIKTQRGHFAAKRKGA